MRGIARRNELVEAHLDLVPPIARRLAAKLPNTFELEDLISAGYLGLVLAADRYKAGPIPFAAFARFRVLGAMLDSVRRGNWSDAVARVTLDELPELAVAFELELEETLDDRRRAAALEDAIGSLAARHRTVIRRHYTAGDRLNRVARRLHVSKSRASQIHLAAVRALKVAVAGAA